MIEGIRIELSSAELQSHFNRRVGYHTDKREFYERQVQTLTDGGVTAQGVTNDPTTSLKNSARQHADKAAFFAFLAEHLIPNETYRLSESDFTRLEFAAQAAMW